MATKANTANAQASDPGDSAMSPDPAKSTSNYVAGDIRVSLTEGAVVTGAKGSFLQLVLMISADSGATASTDANGKVTITATNRNPVTQYVVCNMNSADPSNWTLNVSTSGGSGYTFVKGNGGGGH